MIQENINNLISLWQVAGNSVNSYFENENFNYAVIENSDWPNRIWFDHDVDNKSLNAAKEFLSKQSKNLTVPYWDIYDSYSDELFESYGFKIKFKQIGMSMKLKNKFDFKKRLTIELVSNEKEAQLWENIYPEAFGYRISKEILLNTQNKIDYYLASINDEPIGTAIVYNTGNVSGIHGVGVIPSARRQGFAEEIMKHVLNESINVGMKFSTLQASDMGKGIYLRLGYSEDFTIKNFILD
ncbi:MAG: GNAT family N-acetyltransferase [Melioribacteraceae bacterium]|nr:GNAT family N-acetyltransferase [Melioribacteraceae bacterium]